ncbi:MAG: nicotinate-nucleotide adenylyltransferase [Chloroflexota bacterium]
MSKTKRIGVFGGTFDPIHVGHLILAEEACHQLDLDHILVMPTADPSHKQDRQIAPVKHRIAMVELAIADNPKFVLSRLDVDRPGPHQTADTIRLLQGLLGEDTQIFFLMGLDNLRDLLTWGEAAWLVHNCTLVAFKRHDIIVDWSHLEKAIPDIREHVVVLNMPALEISSSDLRMRIQTGQPIQYQVPSTVQRYIHLNALYE